MASDTGPNFGAQRRGSSTSWILHVLEQSRGFGCCKTVAQASSGPRLGMDFDRLAVEID